MDGGEKAVENMLAKTENNELLKELLTKQLKTVQYQKRLQYSDLKRVCKYISSSIFDPVKCCKWEGYITNSNNTCGKGTYINFYFRKKKAALHRLLYSNFIGDLLDDEYLKFGCENKGTCCNINHFKKFKYLPKTKKIEEQAVQENEATKKTKLTKVEAGKAVQIFKDNTNKIVINFD